MTEKDLYEILANQKIRLFNLSLDNHTMTLIHTNKTVEEWRSDLRGFISKSQITHDKDGCANDDVFNSLIEKLRDAGYVEVNDIVADVYEGRTAVYSAGVVDDPAHEEQSDGFGHYGWGSKE
jgi:hypothetical protein